MGKSSIYLNNLRRNRIKYQEKGKKNGGIYDTRRLVVQLRDPYNLEMYPLGLLGQRRSPCNPIYIVKRRRKRNISSNRIEGREDIDISYILAQTVAFATFFSWKRDSKLAFKAAFNVLHIPSK